MAHGQSAGCLLERIDAFVHFVLPSEKHQNVTWHLCSMNIKDGFRCR
jgi:hypothetical protein